MLPLLAALTVLAAPEPCRAAEPIDGIVSRTFGVKDAPAPGDDVVFYYACQGLAAQSRGPCDHLKKILGSEDTPKAPCPGCPAREWSPSRICLDTWRDITRTKIDSEAALPGAQARCVAFVRDNPDDENLNFKDDEAACKIILAHTYQPEDRIPLLVPLASVYLSSTDVAYAIRDEKHLLGNSTEKECRALPDHRRPRCLSATAYRKAAAKKDIKACGDWPLCRALLSGDAQHCKPYADRIRASPGPSSPTSRSPTRP